MITKQARPNIPPTDFLKVKFEIMISSCDTGASIQNKEDSASLIFHFDSQLGEHRDQCQLYPMKIIPFIQCCIMKFIHWSAVLSCQPRQSYSWRWPVQNNDWIDANHSGMGIDVTPKSTVPPPYSYTMPRVHSSSLSTHTHTNDLWTHTNVKPQWIFQRFEYFMPSQNNVAWHASHAVWNNARGVFPLSEVMPEVCSHDTSLERSRLMGEGYIYIMWEEQTRFGFEVWTWTYVTYLRVWILAPTVVHWDSAEQFTIQHS